MVKKSFILFLFLVAALALPARAEDISAKSAIVYEPESGAVLYECNADERMLIASTTKIMTALVVLEHCAMGDQVDITQNHAAVEGSSMYLKPGESYTVGDLLYGLLLASGNDAAAALAEHVAGDMESFARLMNECAEQMGLKDTHFVNSHGLDADGHYSTARELALITAEAMKNETFCEIFASRKCTVKGVNYVNHNKLLGSYDGCIGGKTGYTDRAGRILVSCAQREGMRLICVTISDPDDWKDHAALYDEAFAKYTFVPALTEPEKRLSVISGTQEYVELMPEIKGIVLEKGAAVTKSVRLPSFVYAPVKAGEKAGSVVISDGGSSREIEVNYAQTVLIDGAVPLTPLERLKRAWYLSCRYGVYYVGER